MDHCNLVHKFTPMPQAMKVPDAKASLDKEWKKLETVPAWKVEKARSKKEVILEAHRDKKKVHFCFIDGHVSPEECGVGTKTPEVSRTNRAPRGPCQRRLWSLRSFH